MNIQTHRLISRGFWIDAGECVRNGGVCSGANDMRMAFIAVGSVLIMAARSKLPPKGPNDPPHGQEWLQMVWAWVQGVFKGKP